MQNGWRIAAASKAGTSHLVSGIPCQDAYAIEHFVDYRGDAVTVFVVSDGAGSASRADEGASITCCEVISFIKDHLNCGRALSDFDVDTAKALVVHIQTSIGNIAGRTSSPVREFACTLLFAAFDESAAIIGQIGDGATVVNADGGWCWVHWPQHGEFANTTNFVTQDSAMNDLQFDRINRRIDEIAMFSDGIEKLVLHYSTRSVFSPFFEKMILPVRASKNFGIDHALSASLGTYLESNDICMKTDDDKTLIIASRVAQIDSYTAKGK